MTALTTRQRDILTLLLKAELPLATEDLAGELALTPRQVTYGMKGIKQWLLSQGVEIEITPGVGIELRSSKEQSASLLQDLNSLVHFQLILSPGERQQLLALVLLHVDEPMYLTALEELTQVSRSTVCKDLDVIEAWICQRELTLIRRPNFGIEVDGTENVRQDAIAALLWGETPFGKSLVQINHAQNLNFLLQKDVDLHPLVDCSSDILQRWNMERVFSQIAYAEVQLGGRFTDDAVLHLALVLAIQTDRIAQGHHIVISSENIQSLKNLPVWLVAKMMAMRLGWKLSPDFRDIDIAGVAMRILAAPRNERWPGDLDLEICFNGLIVEIMQEIADYYETPEMVQDTILRNGLVNHIIPACLRQKYGLWGPSPHPDYALSDKYEYEHQIAQILTATIKDRTTFQMPFAEINNLAALLRAARIRIRPYRFSEVLVVCPSGMASAQLLVARLEARFPRLGPLKVVSLRELTDEEMSSADLIITTIPINKKIHQQIDVIQVNPLLLPEDVENLTRYFT